MNKEANTSPVHTDQWYKDKMSKIKPDWELIEWAKENINKSIAEDYFIYRGHTVFRLIAGFMVLSKKCFTMEQIDDIIDNALTSLVKSIKK